MPLYMTVEKRLTTHSFFHRGSETVAWDLTSRDLPGGLDTADQGTLWGIGHDNFAA